jgi:hypothetical protein
MAEGKKVATMSDGVLKTPAAVDRTLLAVCAVIWLAVLGVSVAAAVVLADLGSASNADGSESDTPWLLYTVIGVSALVIAGSVPLLLRARNGSTPARRTTPQVVPAARADAGEPTTEKLKIFGSRGGTTEDRSRPPAAVLTSPASDGPSVEMVDRIVLRCSALLLGAIGLGLVVVATATYLMGVESDTAAWVALGVAGVITVAMPVIPMLYLGRLRSVRDSLGADD